MNNKKLDKLISLSPFVIAVLVPVGRFVVGKILKQKKEKQLKTKK